MAVEKAKTKDEAEQTELALEAEGEQDQQLTAGSSETSAVEETTEQEAAKELEAQITILKRAEEASRQRAEQAELDRQQSLQIAQEREAEIGRLKKSGLEHQYDAIVAALAAAKAEADAAERDIENAIINDDRKLQAEAYRRLARSEATIGKLEDGRIELEEIVKNPPPVQRQQTQQRQNDPLAHLNIPENAKTWLRQHPEYLTDQRKNSKIQALHWDVVDEGHAAFSTEYFESLEKHLGMREGGQQRQQQQESRIVSAPVSRDVPNSNQPVIRDGKVTLTKEQKEYAKIAGVSEIDYAKGLQQLAKEKANGNYGGQR